MERENLVLEQYSWLIEQNRHELIIMKGCILYRNQWRDDANKVRNSTFCMRNSSIIQITHSDTQIVVSGPKERYDGVILNFGYGQEKLIEEIYLKLISIVF